MWYPFVFIMRLENPLADKIFTVSEIDKIIASTVDELFFGLSVEGEVANFKTNQSKHWYFSLKDRDGSILSCTFFRGDNWRTKPPGNGDFVVVSGNLSFWAKGGSLSFNVKRLENKGEGDIRIEIEKRRAYYQSLGYFDESIKKKIPDEIKTIGVVTSESGAVFHDILNVTKRRAPGINIILFPSMVQGEGADVSIANRIRNANMFSSVIDVLIVGRGGGSEEDLLPYSSREVIEAIHESRIPVVSAVGHETDMPLSDLVADKRAPTPSAAAEIVTETAWLRAERLSKIRDDLKHGVTEKLFMSEKKLKEKSISEAPLLKRIYAFGLKIEDVGKYKVKLENGISGRLREIDTLSEEIKRALLMKKERRKLLLEASWSEEDYFLSGRLKEMRMRLKGNSDSLSSAASMKLSGAGHVLTGLKKEMEALSPMKVLSRGYSIIQNENGNVVISPEMIKNDEKLLLTLKEGKVAIKIKEKTGK